MSTEAGFFPRETIQDKDGAAGRGCKQKRGQEQSGAAGQCNILAVYSSLAQKMQQQCAPWAILLTNQTKGKEQRAKICKLSFITGNSCKILTTGIATD